MVTVDRKILIGNAENTVLLISHNIRYADPDA